jgi:hypothetical protein
MQSAVAIADALLARTMACPCDQPATGVPLCAACASLLSLMIGAVQWDVHRHCPALIPWKPPALEDT